jgi:23S rRNA pseudouridine1911/1915/1917 synthase
MPRMSPDEHCFTVTEDGVRLDRFLSGCLPDVSRNRVQALVRDGQVQVNDGALKAGVRLRSGDVVRVNLPPAPDMTPAPEAIPLAVLFEDEHLAVIDKPAGLVVHPGDGNESGTLVNAMLSRWPEVALLEDRLGIVHRLDKDTSGLLVVARSAPALADLMRQFRERTVAKAYIALLESTPRTATGVVDAPIARDPNQRKRMAVVAAGRAAVTEFEVIDSRFAEGRALVRLHPLTGRTHQLRVHMAFIGCPIVGDRVYGLRRQRVGLRRQFLHAAELAFDHPETGERLHFTSPLPVALQNLIDKLHS